MHVATRDRSKALFGATHMLEVCSVVARKHTQFSAHDIATETAINYPTVHRLLQNLAAADLVMRQQRERGQREQLYRRQRSKFWAAMVELHANATSGNGKGGSV